MKYRKYTIQEIAFLVSNDINTCVQRFTGEDRHKIINLRRYYINKLKENAVEQGPTKPNEKLDLVRDLLERSGIDVEDIGKINRVNLYQGYMKNAEGEFETTDLVSLQYTPKAEFDENLFVSQADPTIIRPTKLKPRTDRKERHALIITDAQIWQGRKQDGELFDFHDKTAMEIVQAIGREEQPDDIIIVGDLIDFPSISRFKQERAYEDTMTPSLNEVHKFLAQLRANCPDANIVITEGNHELRLRNFIYNNARQLYGITRPGDEIPMLDIRNLLRLNELEIEYLDGYPNGRHWLNDRLKVVHGNTVKQLGKTVTNLIRNDDTSSIVGHIHRFEMATRTIPGRHAGRLVMAASFGTLSRIDGAVPSVHSSLNSEDEPMLHIEQWQQGAGWVSYTPGDKPFDIQPIQIHTFDNYETRFGGKLYTPGGKK